MPEPIVFIGYSRKDEKLKNEFLTHLDVLQGQGLIDVWSDDRINAGGEWKEEVKQTVMQAKVAILVITANFLGSSFIQEEIVPILRERHRNKDLIVFPVIARPCAWEQVSWLDKMEVRPKGGRPIRRDKSTHTDEDLANIVTEVAKIIKDYLETLKKSDEISKEQEKALLIISEDLKKSGQISNHQKDVPNKILDDLPASGPVTLPPPPPPIPSPLSKKGNFSIGTVIDGRYKIREMIGRGGMGVVYRARDMALERDVALKHINSDEGKQRFRRGVQAAARIKHPNIVTIHDFNLDYELPYVVMELIDDGNLGQKLSGQPQSWTRTFDLFRPLINAVAHIHEQGIVHRDIKPANIMFEKDNKLKLVDFGLALREGAEPVTRTGQHVAGTILYSSPEQAKKAAVDARTDIFSLGIIMFESLAGYNPLIGETPILFRREIDLVFAELRSNEPLDLSILRAKAPDMVIEIIQKTLSKNREDRYPDCRSLLAALDRCLNVVNSHYNTGVMAYTEGQPEDLNKAIEILEKQIEALEVLKAEDEKQDLSQRLELLKKKKMLRVEELYLDEVKARTDELRFIDSRVLNHYQKVDEFYQALIEAEPQNEEWPNRRLERLIEQAEYRHIFAVEAQKMYKPRNDEALKHYRFIGQLQQKIDDLGLLEIDLAKRLNIDLDHMIDELEKEMVDDERLYEIRDLMAQQEHEKARNQLVQHFLNKGNYNRPDVALLLWMLTYREKYSEFPIRDIDIFQLEALVEYALDREQTRIDLLIVTLKPWSNFSEIIEYQRSLYQTCILEIDNLEERLNSLSENLNGISDLDALHSELSRAKDCMQAWFNCLQYIEENAVIQKIDNWLGIVENIYVNLQTHPFEEEVVELVRRIHRDLNVIEEDALYMQMQALPSIALEARRTVNYLHVRLVEMFKRDMDQLQREHKFIQYIIPVAVISALIIGGVASILIEIIAQTRFQENDIVVLAIIGGLGLLFFVASYFYYVRTYEEPFQSHK